MSGGRSTGAAARWSLWRVPAITALAGHLLLVPLYFAARGWDLSRQPLGFGHWPGEPGWPAGSGSSEWRPGELLLLVGWLLVLLVILCTGIAAGVVALIRRRGPREQTSLAADSTLAS